MLCLACLSLKVYAEDATYLELNDSDELLLMSTLVDYGLHNMKDERWCI